MRAMFPSYWIDADDTVDVGLVNGRCHLRLGSLTLVFDSAVEAEGALDEASLALRLLTVGADGGR